jgi:membrane protein DedA with SNARE-associated domain/rhodanese-related sulfurtransferase
MHQMITLMEQYGLAVVFANVLLEQAGLPLPAYPTLILAGALLARGEHSASALLVTAVFGAMIADSLWYLAGRRFGTPVLALLCRISLTPDTCVRQTTLTFGRFGAPSLLVAKFVPGFAAIAGALCGVVGISYFRFFVFDLLGAAIWAGVAIGVGYIFREAIDDVLQWVAAFGAWALVIGVALLGAYLFYKWWQRREFARQMEMERISVEQLQLLMREGTRTVILDARLPALQSSEGRIPGARSLHIEQIEDSLAGLAVSDEIVVYCSCPNDASAVTLAKALRQRGFQKVRPLRGGFEAWTAAGCPLERQSG